VDLDITRFPHTAIDSETTGLVYPKDKAFGISIATPDGKSYYYDLRTDGEVIPILNAQLADYTGTIICHNASFDYRMLDRADIFMPIDQLDDTVIRECCLDEHAHSYRLDDLALKYLGERKVSDIYQDLSKLYGGAATRKAQMGNLHRAPKDVVAPYASKDALLTLRVWEAQNDAADRQNDGSRFPIQSIWDFERSIMPHLIRMEMKGIRVDLDAAREAMDRLDEKITIMHRALAKDTGNPKFNVNSSPQVRAFLAPTLTDSGK
jgi:DNA polymerase I-like protein with 3'-5' exonuclease and polymerase domains